MDFVMNGNGGMVGGGIGAYLLQNGFDVDCLRPWIGRDNRTYMNRTVVDAQGFPVRNADGSIKKEVVLTNAVATLRYNDWLQIDEAIVRAAIPRLKLIADLRAAGLTYSFDAFGKTVLAYERVGRAGAAQISMDGIRQGPTDRPHFDLVNLPLPIIHEEFEFTARQIANSRAGGHEPIDTTMGELAAENVAEKAEQLALGKLDNYAFGGGTIYGMRTYPQRLTNTLTAPTTSGWTGATLVSEILAMRQHAANHYHSGPFVLYMSPAWDTYLDADYSSAKGDNTLRDRIARINGISSVRTLDYFGTTAYEALLVEQRSSVVRLVIGMDIVTVQWPSHGGMQLNFKVMCIMVPQLRCDQNNHTGLVHGSTVAGDLSSGNAS